MAENPGEISTAFLEGLSPEERTYILTYVAKWEAFGDEALSKGDDALEACADYNHMLNELRGGNEAPS